MSQDLGGKTNEKKGHRKIINPKRNELKRTSNLNSAYSYNAP